MTPIIIGVCGVYSVAKLFTVLPIKPACIISDVSIVRTASLKFGEIIDGAIFSNNRTLIYD